MAWADGYRDADAARDEVSAWLRGVGAARGWSSSQTAAALALVTDAYEAADSAEWFGTDVRVFWVALGRGVQRPEFRTYPEWARVADTVRQALVTVDAEEAYRFDTSWYGGAMGGTTAAASSVATAASDAAAKVGEVANKVTSPVWIWGVAVTVVAVAVIQSGGLRRMR